MQKGRTWTRMGRRSSRHAPALSTWGPTRGPCCPYLLTPTRGPLQFGGDSSARAATASLACAMGNEFMREHLRYIMVHVESGSRPPSWPQNEVNILIDSVTSH
jgi:hypothetical protein